MTVTYVAMIGFFALVAWRIVLAVLRHRHLAGAVATARERRNNALQHGLHILRRANLSAIAQNSYQNGLDGTGSVEQKDRAEIYLRRIVALTGATQTGRDYVLDVGKTRFHVRHRFVTRFQDLTNPQSPRKETCFYPVHKEMPKAEEIATVLLQLANNPALFDKWAAQDGRAFKADGEVFASAQ